MPVGKLKGADIENFFLKSIDYHLHIYKQTFQSFDRGNINDNWALLIRSIDEIINFPIELNKRNVDTGDFLNLDYNFLLHRNFEPFRDILTLLETNFDKEVAQRFLHLTIMSSAIHGTYTKQGVYSKIGSDHNLASVGNAINFYQARRAYFVATFFLLPFICKGNRKIPYLDTLNQFAYLLESCMINITNSYYHLVKNESLPDYEVTSDGNMLTGNYNEYEHLEMFFLEPERLSLIDQIELRMDGLPELHLKVLPPDKVFSYAEIDNALSIYAAAFKKYKIGELEEFRQLSFLTEQLRKYCTDDYQIRIPEAEFYMVTAYLVNIKPYLVVEGEDYFAALNSFAAFSSVEGEVYSTVVLMTRLISRTIATSMLRNRTFQINSGFVFEDRISEILASHGFKLTGITRINKKEFDVITVKDEVIYNFQCKNNFLDITGVSRNYKKMGRLNRSLVRYYEQALVKEEKREDLIKQKLCLSEIKHFVISRYPVMTRNSRIINFASLESWLLLKTK